MKSYYVYILANNGKMLYTGITSDLEKSLYEHKHHLVNGYTKKYSINKLVYFEETSDANAAIEREKQVKGWLRQKKIALIESVNPEWRDLTETGFEFK
jgi:putative endonuclease